PVADRVIHEFQLRHLAEILNRKHRCKYRLQSAVIALAGQQIHLQKALIRLHLDFNQVGNLNRALNFCKIQTLPNPNVLIGVRHYWYTSLTWTAAEQPSFFGRIKLPRTETNSCGAFRLARSQRAHSQRLSRWDISGCSNTQPRRA